MIYRYIDLYENLPPHPVTVHVDHHRGRGVKDLICNCGREIETKYKHMPDHFDTPQTIVRIMDCDNCGCFLVSLVNGSGTEGSVVKAWLGSDHPMLNVAKTMANASRDQKHGMSKVGSDAKFQYVRSGYIHKDSGSRVSLAGSGQSEGSHLDVRRNSPGVRTRTCSSVEDGIQEPKRRRM